MLYLPLVLQKPQALMAFLLFSSTSAGQSVRMILLRGCCSALPLVRSDHLNETLITLVPTLPSIYGAAQTYQFFQNLI